MNEWKVNKSIELKSHHAPTGRTRHQVVNSKGAQDFPPFVKLQIAQFEGDGGFYLLYLPEEGQGTDTWHKSLEDAMHQAEFEFNVRTEEWTDVS